MRRKPAWVPMLAAPVAVLGHIVSETVASGHPFLVVAREPSHLVFLILALAAMPLWSRAAGSRRLGHAIFAAIAVSLLVEGNGLGAAAMLTALAISAVISWLTGLAFAAMLSTGETGTRIHRSGLVLVDPVCEPERSGPYYAFVPSRGNRPPPLLLT